MAVWGSSVSGLGRPGLAPGLGLGLMCLILLGTAAMGHVVLIANCQKGRRERNTLRPLRLQPSHLRPLSIGQGCHMVMPNLKGWENIPHPIPTGDMAQLDATGHGCVILTQGGHEECGH